MDTAHDTKTPSALEQVSRARLAEEAGDLDEAISAYNAALAADESCAEALRGLAELRRDQGDFERALRCLERLREMGDPAAARSLIDVLVDCGRRERALEVAAGIGAEAVAELERSLAADESVRGGDLDAPPAPTDADLALMADLFGGREGVHARQWAARDGRAGYSPVHRPLTPALVRQHLLGAATLGTYPVRRDDTCLLLAFDIDAPGLSLDSGRAETATALGKTLAAARRLEVSIREAGLDCALEESGFKGHHLWVFFDEPWPAWKARRLGRAIAEAAGPATGEVSVEVFPAQGRVRPGGLGNLIKLPLGVHLRTGRRGFMVDADGRRATDPFALLAATRRVPAELLEEALERLAAGRPEDDGPSPGGGGREEDGPAPNPSFAGRAEPMTDEQARAVWLEHYELDDDEELARLVDCCASLRALVTEARGGAPLDHDRQAVLTYTIGHLTHGASAVNALMAASGSDARPLRSRLRGHPMSCPKIRGRLGLDPAEPGCDCEFDPTLGQYPHPLLHLAGLRAERLVAAAALASRPRPELERELERARREVERLGRHIEALEQALAVGIVGTEPAAGEIPGLAKAGPGSDDEPAVAADAAAEG